MFGTGNVNGDLIAYLVNLRCRGHVERHLLSHPFIVSFLQLPMPSSSVLKWVHDS